MDKLGWGVVSTGRIAEWFCEDFHAVPNGALRAVVSRSQSSADAFANRFKINGRYDDFNAMLSDDSVDVVYIGTPHTTHLDYAARALQAGKAVLCEKPLTVGAAECRSLIETADQSGAYLMEAMWTYFLPAMRKAQEWVDAGRIGPVHHVKTDFGYPVPYGPKNREYDADLGGGVLLEMGIYPVAIAKLFANAPLDDVLAVGRRAPNGVEDDVTAILRFGEMTATIGASFRARLRNAAYIIGPEGYIVIPDAFRCSECFLYRLEDCIDHFSAPRSTRGYEYQAIAVNEDIANGRKQSAIAPHAMSLALQQTIDAIKAKLA